MPIDPYTSTNIATGDFADVPVPTIADDGRNLTWSQDANSLVFVDRIALGTRAAILATEPPFPLVALATDTREFLLWDGETWNAAPLELDEVTSAPDMGLLPPMVTNDRSGYSRESITDKKIYNSRILGSSVEEEGSIRTVTGEMQVFLNGAWQTVTAGFRFMEDGGLQYQPVGSELWFDVATGNSDAVGLNGLPLVQGWTFVSMGAYPAPMRIQGREIVA